MPAIGLAQGHWGGAPGAFCELRPGLAALDFTARGFTMTCSIAAFGDVRSLWDVELAEPLGDAAGSTPQGGEEVPVILVASGYAS